MAISQIQDVRLMVGDVDVSLPFLTDEVYQFYLDRNASSTTRAAVEAARAILFQLAQRTDESCDIFSFRGSKASAAYMEALKLFLRDPSLNPLYNNCGMYAGGISVSDIAANNANTDNVNSTNVFNTVNQSTLFTGGF